MAGWFAKLAGIIGSTLQLDVVGSGPRLKNNAGVMEVRDAADAVYALERAGNSIGPAASNDLWNAQTFTPTYYANTATGNDANPGTLASPFATLAHAMAVVLPYQTATINLAGAQTFTMPAAFTLPHGAQITIVGVYASQLGSRTAAAGSTTTVVNDTAGGLTVNASRGDLLLFDPATSTVALRGKQGTIRANAAGSFTLFDTLPAVPSATDTFTVQRSSTTVTTNVFTQWVLSGGMVLMDVILLTTGAANPIVKFIGGEFRIRGYRIDQTASTSRHFFYSCKVVFGSLLPFLADQFAGVPAGTIEHGGLMIGGANAALVGCEYACTSYAQDLCLTNLQLSSQFAGSVLNILGVDSIGGPLVVTNGGEMLVNASVSGNASSLTGSYTGLDAISATTGGQLDLASVTIATWTGNAVSVAGRSRVSLTSVTGAGNTGVGLAVLSGSVARNISGNTVTGTADVQMGGSAATIAWPAPNTLATDQAAAASQFCLMK